ncbi:hypothetical protein ACLSZN_02470 [Avibacterium avium]|uniref:hypothetical protein n=1 Tax=Avibacterium avium TaxID=751 RepID=UPI003BF7810E
MFSRLLIYFLKKSGLAAAIKKAIAELSASDEEQELTALKATLRQQSQRLFDELQQLVSRANPPNSGER